MALTRTYSLREYTIFSAGRRALTRGLVAVAIGLAAFQSVYWSLADRPKEVQLTTPTANLQVSLAESADKRAAGLSNRDAIPNDGMLLQWDAPGRHPIWMPEMRFALDLVWLDGDGRVLAVLANVPPCTAMPCPLYEPPGSERSTAVLELPAGRSATYGLTVGAVVRRE